MRILYCTYLLRILYYVSYEIYDNLHKEYLKKIVPWISRTTKWITSLLYQIDDKF